MENQRMEKRGSYGDTGESCVVDVNACVLHNVHSTAQHSTVPAQWPGANRAFSRPCERFLTRNGIHLPWHCPMYCTALISPCRMPCHVVMLCLGIASTSDDVDERRDETWVNEVNQVQGAAIEH